MNQQGPPNTQALFTRNNRSASFDDPYRGRKTTLDYTSAAADNNIDNGGEGGRSVLSFCGPSRFQPHDPIIQQLFKKFGDTELLFSAEVNKVNKVMKFQKRILVISDKYVYNMHPKTYQVKRAIVLDRVSKVHLSELRDDFLFIHVDNERDYLYHTDRKTEIIQVLKLAKREKIPAHMRVSSWYAEGELEIMVGNTFQYAPEKHDVKIPVEFTFDETLQTKEQVIESTKDKLTIRLMREDNRIFAIESIIMELKDYGSFGGSPMSSPSRSSVALSGSNSNGSNSGLKAKCDKCFDEDEAVHFCTNCKELLCDLHSRAHRKDKSYRDHTYLDAEQYQLQLQQSLQQNSANIPSSPVTPSSPAAAEIKYIDVTDDPGIISIQSPKSEYQLVVRFRVHRNMDDLRIIQTTTGTTKKQQVTHVGNIQLYSSDLGRERFKRMELRLDPVQVTNTFSGNVKVSIQFQSKTHKKPPLFKTYFSYTCSSKKRFSIWK